MSSICAVSALVFPTNKSNNDINGDNINEIKHKSIDNVNDNHSNHSNDSQEIINNLKLIREKIEVNGINGKEKDINGSTTNGNSNSPVNSDDYPKLDRKSLQLNINLAKDVVDGSNDCEIYSEVSTLSSSPVASPDNYSMGQSVINQALLDQKFSKLSFTDFNRYESPMIHINGSFDEDEEFCDVIRAPLIRSTSLKTGKTPPSTPHKKKIVRFADALGLNLESVRHIISDDLPNVPKSAFGLLKTNDFRLNPSNGVNDTKAVPWYMQKSSNTNATSVSRPNLILEFIQPSSLLNFLDRIRNNKVCLENCMVSNNAGNLSITCIIRVLNISFEKSVTLRYTTNEWLTHNEALASYISNSCDGFSDKFSVTFSVSAGGYYLSPGQRLLFALKYNANTDEYWDNNMGLNYSLIYRP
ncbi:uncharacterized protein LOC128962210 [Oppia nitens]|uniref:uncharacterized protein LOC128962210 n=1 Tax=Oppia nitens TaxID=1686743 RepID=UPI0023DBD229|nr:uncharacterized protein LOC128962210 [Oppia nitens]